MIFTDQDLDEAVRGITDLLMEIGEPVTWRHAEGISGDPPQTQYSETTIQAIFTPIPPGLVSSGLYQKTDLTVRAAVAPLPGDFILRFGEAYAVIEEPFAHRIRDRILYYETKLRKQ